MTTEQALSRMTALCSTAEHCEADIRRKLQRTDLTADDMQAVIDRLYADGYLDTRRYCRAYANDQMRFAHWGRQKIAAALRSKQLPEADIDEALALLPDDEHNALLARLLRDKLRHTPQPTRQKLVRYAIGRGFTYDEICRQLDALHAQRGTAAADPCMADSSSVSSDF